MPLYLLLPLAASILYCLAALFLKSAITEGVGPWRSAFVSNWALALISLPLWLLPTPTTPAPASELMLGALLGGFCFFCGQVGTFLAITRGDVSVATPVLGLKILFVALLGVVLFGLEVRPALIVGAAIATVGVALLQLTPGRGGHRRVFMTVLYAGGSSFCFAITDLVVAAWAPRLGAGRLIPIMFLVNALLSFGMFPFFSRPLSHITAGGWKWLLPGAALLGVQAMCMASALSVFGHATEVNIVYGLRSLWSVLLVWSVGSFFQNTERETGLPVFVCRLIGAVLTLSAVAVVMVK